MENFDRENIDELLEIHQIRQYFPCQNFALYGMYTCEVLNIKIIRTVSYQYVSTTKI